MDKYFRVHLVGTAPDDVMASGMYVDMNGVLYFFDDKTIIPCDGYDQMSFNADVTYAPGVWTKVVTVKLKESEDK